MKKKGQKQNLQELFPGIALSLAAGFMFFLYSPLELYFTNKDEFWFDFWLLFPTMFLVFLVFFGVSVLFLRFLLIRSRKVYRITVVAYFIAFLCSYIQGNYLTGNLPPLDGTSIDWSLYPAERIKSVLVWVIAIIVVSLVFKYVPGKEKFFKAIGYVGAFVAAVQFVTLISVGIMNGGFEKRPNMSVSTKNQLELSSNENFIILLLDALDANGWSEVAQNHPEYQDMLKDFTFYKNAVGMYSFTKHSIPLILSGEWYENEEPFQEYSARAYLNSPLFEELREKSYKLGLYEMDLILNDEGFYQFENILPNKKGVSSWPAFIRWQIQMTGFKYAPFDLKRFCFVKPDAFKKLRIPPEESEVYTDSNKDFYESILEEGISLTKEKCFRFIHISGAHVPFQYDENVNIISNGTYESNVEASMTITREYLERLKESGVYDNSVIVIMADHGYCWKNQKDTLHRQNPVLFIKGMEEEHDFQVSEAPISWTDLQEAFKRLLAGKESTEVFDYKEGDFRERRYLYYEYNKDEHMYEYIQSGYADDVSTFNATGHEYILN